MLSLLKLALGIVIAHHQSVLGFTSTSVSVVLRPAANDQNLLSASRLFLESKKISWSDYKHDFIDPISESHGSHLEGHMDPAKRQVSDQFWLAQFEEDKERLHQMNVVAAAAAASTGKESTTEPTTSFDTYKHDYIEPMVETNRKSNSLIGHMDPNIRAEADEFWLQTFLEEKKKIHGKHTP